MKLLCCASCGGGLELSVSNNAYVCQTHPREHKIDRQSAERTWIAQAQAAADSAPRDVQAQTALAATFHALCQAARAACDGPMASLQIQRAADVLRDMHSDTPADPSIIEELVGVLGTYADVCEEALDFSQCKEVFNEMLAIIEEAIRLEPANIARHRELAMCLNGIGRCCRALGDVHGARISFMREKDVATVLWKAHQKDPNVATDLAIVHFNLYLTSTERTEELDHLTTAIKVLDSACLTAKLSEQGEAAHRRVREELDRLLKEPQITVRTGVSMTPSISIRPPAPMAGTVSILPGSLAPNVSTAISYGTMEQWLVEGVRKELARRWGAGSDEG